MAILKWVHTTKWDQKFGKVKHTYRLNGAVCIVAINGRNRAEWRFHGEIGYVATVKLAKDKIISMIVFKRLTEIPRPFLTLEMVRSAKARLIAGNLTQRFSPVNP